MSVDVVELPEEPVTAVVGATGAVGETILTVLEERSFPLSRLIPIASEQSRGNSIQTPLGEQKIVSLPDVDWDEIDLALMSAGSSLSRDIGKVLVDKDVLVVDNSSAFRLDGETPLVVPEVNWDDDVRQHSFVANPNCSATQLVMVLKPLYDRYGIEHCSVSTYQSVSGAGGRALSEFEEQSRAFHEGNEPESTSQFRDPVVRNVLPFIPHGKNASIPFGTHTGEEQKVIGETQKILGNPDLKISVTCARVPVEICHSQSLHLALETSSVDPGEIRACLNEFPGVEVVEEGDTAKYPQPRTASGTDPVYAGRIRPDSAREGGIALWTVGDNLRKGAALNTVQIAERFLPQ